MAQLPIEWIGPVVAATLKERDLIAAFEGLLDIAGEEYDRPPAVDKIWLTKPLTAKDRATVVAYRDTLLILLNGVAPRGTSFGTRPGDDGPDFGFWPNPEESRRVSARKQPDARP
jgi:hypothetical protein